MNKPTLFENYYNIDADANIEKPSLMIPLGVNSHGILEQVEITDEHWQHIVVAGHAGTGKSNYLHTVLASLLLSYSADQVNLWLSDGGMCEFNRFADSAPAHIKRVNTTSDPASYIAFVDDLETEVDNRLKYLASVEKTSFYVCYQAMNQCPFPRLAVMIDGFDHFIRCLSEVDHQYVNKVEHIVRRASVCGITFVISMQEALIFAQYTSRSFLELFIIRVATKQLSDSYSVLFNHRTADLTRDLKFGEMITSNFPEQKLNMLYISADIENQIAKR